MDALAVPAGKAEPIGLRCPMHAQAARGRTRLQILVSSPFACHGHQPAYGQQNGACAPQGSRHRQGQRGQHGGVPRGVSAKPPQAAMSACRRSCCAMPSSTRLQVPAPPALGQFCHERAPDQQGASGAAMLSRQHHSGGARGVKQNAVLV